MDRFETMRVFHDLVQSGSLSATARRMGLSPSMVGKHLNDLEARLGVKLLHRTTRRHKLTEAGELYFEHCSTIIEQMVSADGAVAALGGKPSGTLRVSAPVSFGGTQLAPKLGLFLAQYPDIHVELSLSDSAIDPIGDSVDLAFRFGPLGDSGLVARPLLPYYTMIVCASSDYLQRCGTPRVPHDLMRHSCLSHTRWGMRHTWRFEGPEGGCAISINPRLRIDNGPALREAALAGAGVIMQPLSLVKRDIDAGRLVRVLAEYRSPGRDLYLLYAKEHPMPAKLRAFIEFSMLHFSDAQVAH